MEYVIKLRLAVLTGSESLLHTFLKSILFMRWELGGHQRL